MARNKILLLVACLGSLGLAQTLSSAAHAATYVFDFDTDANGNQLDVNDLGIAVGDWENNVGLNEDYIVSSQWLLDFGVSIDGYDKPSYNQTTGAYNSDLSQLSSRDLVFFNTDPNYYSEDSKARKRNGQFKSGGTFDKDLLTGHDDLTDQTFLVAKDDSANTPINLGNVLILQENNQYYKPDDNAGGGLISFSFEEMIDLTSIDLLDVSDDFGKRGKQIVFAAYGENGEEIETWKFDEAALNNGTAEQLSEATDNNSLYRFNFNSAGVKRLDVLYPGSGAIAALRWEQNQAPPTIPEPTAVLGLLVVAGLGVRFKRSQTV